MVGDGVFAILPATLRLLRIGMVTPIPVVQARAAGSGIPATCGTLTALPLPRCTNSRAGPLLEAVEHDRGVIAVGIGVFGNFHAHQHQVKSGCLGLEIQSRGSLGGLGLIERDFA